MKSEHRRELHSNELEKISQSIGKFFEKHGVKVLVGLVVCVAIGVGIFWLLSNRGSALASSTQSMIAANSAEAYLNVADDPNVGSQPLGVAARLTAAQMQLENGIQLYGTSASAGRDELEKAKKNLDAVIDSGKLEHELQERALFLRAVAVESLSGRDTSAAVASYQELLEEYPDSSYKSLAEARIAELERDDVKEFYAFLAAGDRKPPERDRPSDVGGLPEGHPPFPGMPKQRKPDVTRNVEPEVTLPPTPPLLRDVGEPEKDDSTVPGPGPFPEFPSPAGKDDGKSDGKTKQGERGDGKTGTGPKLTPDADSDGETKPKP